MFRQTHMSETRHQEPTAVADSVRQHFVGRASCVESSPSSLAFLRFSVSSRHQPTLSRTQWQPSTVPFKTLRVSLTWPVWECPKKFRPRAASLPDLSLFFYPGLAWRFEQSCSPRGLPDMGAAFV